MLMLVLYYVEVGNVLDNVVCKDLGHDVIFHVMKKICTSQNLRTFFFFLKCIFTTKNSSEEPLVLFLSAWLEMRLFGFDMYRLIDVNILT